MKSVILLSTSIEKELGIGGRDSLLCLGWVTVGVPGCEGKEEN